MGLHFSTASSKYPKGRIRQTSRNVAESWVRLASKCLPTTYVHNLKPTVHIVPCNRVLWSPSPNDGMWTTQSRPSPNGVSVLAVFLRLLSKALVCASEGSGVATATWHVVYIGGKRIKMPIRPLLGGLANDGSQVTQRSSLFKRLFEAAPHPPPSLRAITGLRWDDLLTCLWKASTTLLTPNRMPTDMPLLWTPHTLKYSVAARPWYKVLLWNPDPSLKPYFGTLPEFKSLIWRP